MQRHSHPHPHSHTQHCGREIARRANVDRGGGARGGTGAGGDEKAEESGVLIASPFLFGVRYFCILAYPEGKDNDKTHTHTHTHKHTTTHAHTYIHTYCQRFRV